MNAAYTKAEIDRIATMLRDGLSASQISSIMTDRSRNSIIGIVHRNKVLKAIGFANASASRAASAAAQHPGSSQRSRPVLERTAPAGRRKSADGRSAYKAPWKPHRQNPRAKASEDNGRTSAAEGAPMAGEASRAHGPDRAGGTTPSISRDSVERHAPIPFLDAVNGGLCLFFADDPMAPAGPDMPVCGAARQTWSRKPYCAGCLDRERAAA